MRAFAALEVSDATILDGLVDFQNRLKGTGADLKTVERKNIHFTMKFLGEITDSQAKQADGALRALNLPRATAEVKGIGAFPSVSSPGVLWVGVSEDDRGRVEEIAAAAIHALAGIGEEDERPFHPHATLARSRSRRGTPALLALLRSNSTTSFGTMAVTEFKLKSSVLGPGGPTYTDIGAYPLH